MVEIPIKHRTPPAMMCCPVCNSDDTREFLSNPRVPVHQNLIVQTVDDARSVARGSLALRCCHGCGFVFNAAFDAGRMAYGCCYDNTQTASPAFRDHLTAMISRLVNDRGVRGCAVVEVGCGKGEFLRALVAPVEWGNTGVGFDPSYTGLLRDLDGRLRFEQRFYDRSAAQTPAQIVICRHVIEHVPRPLDLLKGIRGALALSPGSRLFLETPCVEWIFENRVIWDFFYEHCSYFSRRSLETALRIAGFKPTSVTTVFGGQYLWAEAQPASCAENVPPEAGPVPHLAIRYESDFRALIDEWKRRLTTLRTDGPVAVWGAGAKGVTFVNIADPDAVTVTCLIDLNPHKIGNFAPGTGHPILSYVDAWNTGVRTAVVVNPNYLEENTSLLRSAGIPMNLVVM